MLCRLMAGILCIVIMTFVLGAVGLLAGMTGWRHDAALLFTLLFPASYFIGGWCIALLLRDRQVHMATSLTAAIVSAALQIGGSWDRLSTTQGRAVAAIIVLSVPLSPLGVACAHKVRYRSKT